MQDPSLDDFEALAREVKTLLEKWPETPEQRREARISWVAGQCALSDSQGRSIDFWKEKAREAVENLEAEGLL